jgi:hypothetical protein
MEEKHYCCDEMKKHFEEAEVAIGYSTKLKSYGIREVRNEDCIEPIDFCPWCGAELAKLEKK